MNIDAIIFDLDGTAIPNKNEGMPSQKVIRAVAKAQKIVKVSAATGRPISNCRHILKALNITSPCVVAGGTQIINPQTEETLWKKELSKEQVKKIIDICSPYNYQIYISDEKESSPASEKRIKRAEQIVYIMAVTTKDTPVIMGQLHKIPHIISHEVISWTQGHFDIHITHGGATKKHALEELLKIENIGKEHVMAVGDSNNDLPLFQIAGYKVAMGNATDKLKKEADYVTAHVDEDGLAEAIEKFIL